MKILFLVPSLFADDGGIPRILRLYTKALSEMPELVDTLQLISLNDEVCLPAEELTRYAGPGLVSSLGCRHSKRRFLQAALRAARGCDRILCGHAALLPVAALAARWARVPRVDFIAHGIEVWRRPRLLERLSLGRVSQAWCVSAFTRDRMREWFPLPLDRTRVLHNGLDAYFEIPAVPAPVQERPVILTVSRLSREDNYKGVDHLIEAMSLLWTEVPEAELRIIGQGDDLARLRRLAALSSRPGQIRFEGRVNDEALAQALLNCRFFALPSRLEGFGLVFLEAMAQGKPCVGARAGGIPEVLTPETGVLVPYGDRQALAKGLAEALQRRWDGQAILARANEFAYPVFRAKLAALLSEPSAA